MSQSRSISTVAGPVAAMAAGALALLQIVFWGLWGFDTPPTGLREIALTGAGPGIAAMAMLAFGATLLRNNHPKSAGRRTALWMMAGPLVAVVAAVVIGQLGIAY